MIKDNIRKYRKEKRMSQEEMAEELHVVRQTVSKWETGKSVPNAEELMKIAVLFDITVNKLLGIEESENVDKLKQDIDYLSEQLDQKIKQEALMKKAEEKRNLILFFSFVVVIISLSVKETIISLFLTVIFLLITLVIFYRNLELLTKVSEENIKKKTLRITLIFNIVFIAISFLFVFLKESNVVHFSEDSEKLIAMCLVSGIMIFVGIVSPRLPYQRYVGLRLPWTIQDEDTWNIAHRILGMISLPLALLYIVCSFIIEDFDKVTLVTIALLICIPGGISLLYYYKKMRGK